MKLRSLHHMAARHVPVGSGLPTSFMMQPLDMLDLRYRLEQLLTFGAVQHSRIRVTGGWCGTNYPEQSSVPPSMILAYFWGTVKSAWAVRHLCTSSELGACRSSSARTQDERDLAKARRAAMAPMTVNEASETLADYRVKTVRAPEATVKLGQLLLEHRWFDGKKDEGRQQRLATA